NRYLWSMMRLPECETDPHLQQLIWWGIETLITRDGEARIIPVSERGKKYPVVQFVAERWARRLAWSNVKELQDELCHALSLGERYDLSFILEGIAKSLEAGDRDSFPTLTTEQLRELRKADPSNQRLLEILVRIKDPDALDSMRDQITNPRLP